MEVRTNLFKKKKNNNPKTCQKEGEASITSSGSSCQDNAKESALYKQREGQQRPCPPPALPEHSLHRDVPALSPLLPPPPWKCSRERGARGENSPDPHPSSWLSPAAPKGEAPALVIRPQGSTWWPCGQQGKGCHHHGSQSPHTQPQGHILGQTPPRAPGTKVGVGSFQWVPGARPR